MQNKQVNYDINNEHLSKKEREFVATDNTVMFFLIFAFSLLIVSLLSMIYTLLKHGAIGGISTIVYLATILCVGLIPALSTASISLRIRKKQRLLGKLNQVLWATQTILWGTLVSGIYGFLLVFLGIIIGFVGWLTAMASVSKIVLFIVLYCCIFGAICSLVSCLFISIKTKH